MFVINRKITEKRHSKKTYTYGCSCPETSQIKRFVTPDKQYCGTVCHKEGSRWPPFPRHPHLRVHRAEGSKAARTLPPSCCKTKSSMSAGIAADGSSFDQGSTGTCPFRHNVRRDLMVTNPMYSERLCRAWYCCSLFSLPCCTEKYPKTDQLT